jgi:hypothetical protein
MRRLPGKSNKKWKRSILVLDADESGLPGKDVGGESAEGAAYASNVQHQRGRSIGAFLEAHGLAVTSPSSATKHTRAAQQQQQQQQQQHQQQQQQQQQQLDMTMTAAADATTATPLQLMPYPWWLPQPLEQPPDSGVTGQLPGAGQPHPALQYAAVHPLLPGDAGFALAAHPLQLLPAAADLQQPPPLLDQHATIAAWQAALAGRCSSSGGGGGGSGSGGAAAAAAAEETAAAAAPTLGMHGGGGTGGGHYAAGCGWPTAGHLLPLQASSVWPPLPLPATAHPHAPVWAPQPPGGDLLHAAAAGGGACTATWPLSACDSHTAASTTGEGGAVAACCAWPPSSLQSAHHPHIAPQQQQQQQQQQQKPGLHLVGMRIEVWWPLDSAWYAATVQVCQHGGGAGAYAVTSAASCSGNNKSMM